MPWKKGKPRRLKDKIKIGRSVKEYYAKTTPTDRIRVRPLLDYSDPYNYGRKLKSLLCKVNNSAMPDYNKRKVKEYKKYIQATTSLGNTYRRVRIIFSELGKFKRQFNKLTRDDLMRVYFKIQYSDLSDYTKVTRVNDIKHFMVWLNDGRKPKYLKYMVTKKKKVAPRNFTIEEVRKFINSCESIEEKAFFSLLWEGGFSVGELLKVTPRDVVIRKDLVEIYVHSKNRDRTTPILRKEGILYPLNSSSLLIEHLKNKRPKIDETIWNVKSYNQAQYRVNKIKKKVGLSHVRLHSFRKSRATYNIENRLGFVQTCVYGGWAIGSRTLQHYITTTGRCLVPSLKKLNSPSGMQTINNITPLYS